jgi:hypothetical protein
MPAAAEPTGGGYGACRGGGAGYQEEEGVWGERERELVLEEDPTSVVSCTNLKEVEVHLTTNFGKIYRISETFPLHLGPRPSPPHVKKLSLPSPSRRLLPLPRSNQRLSRVALPFLSSVMNLDAIKHQSPPLITPSLGPTTLIDAVLFPSRLCLRITRET